MWRKLGLMTKLSSLFAIKKHVVLVWAIVDAKYDQSKFLRWE